MKPLLALAAIVVVGVWAEAKLTETSPTPTAITVVNQLDKLERARQASFEIKLVDYRTGGSAVLVGRTNLANGKYRYRALTAYHVVDDMAKNPIDIFMGPILGKRSKTVILTFQPEFHGEPFQVKLDIDDVDWAVPAHDWASFTFDLEHKLACVEVATEAEFKSIRAFESIYLVGSPAVFGQRCRQGIIGSTHNISTIPHRQIVSEYPWNQHQEKFFHPSFPIWYGDSGGAIFNKDGKLIGIINGFTIMMKIAPGVVIPVTHSGAALKAHLIHDIVEHSENFFKVED